MHHAKRQPREPAPATPLSCTTGDGAERGNTVLVAMLVLVALTTLGGLTLLQVQRTTADAGHRRFDAIALYAAESGAAVAMDALRGSRDPAAGWSDWVTPANAPPAQPADIAGNGALPGAPDNLFAPSLRAWYQVRVLNNPDDPGYASGQDADSRVILEVTGHGPDATVARIQWQIHGAGEEPGPLSLMSWHRLY